MGGRGATSGFAGGTKIQKGAIGGSANTKTNYSTKEINTMNRKQLENVARAIYVKKNTALGLSTSEADYRARSLMSGNTDAQLRKYIKRNG